MEPVFHFQEMFEQSLGLTDPWKVIRAEFNERDRAVHVYLEGRKTAKYPCPICGKEKVRYDEEDEERVWRHADVVMYPCYIHCRRPRVKCETDGIRVVDAPWTRGKYARFTLAFEGYAMLLAGNMSLNEACRILRISRTAMVHIALYWVNRSVAQTRLEEVTRLSVDETSFKRGQSYVTVVGDPERKRVIGVENGRDMDAVDRFSRDFEKRGGDCNAVRHVSMDMSRAYREGVRLCFPKAKVVYDRFHVKKLMLDAMDQIRREEQGNTYSRSRRAGKKLLMIPERRLTETQQEKVRDFHRKYPKLGRAYRMVQYLDDLYWSENKKDAEDVMNQLTSWMMHSRMEPMKKAARTLRQHQTEILEYFEHKMSNAFAEGMNSLIQTAKRKARGFRTYEGYRVAIYLAVGRLQLSCPYPFLSEFSRS